MKFIKLVLAFAAIFLVSCAHSRAPVQNNTTWLDSYEPTGSFCLDAYFVNSAAKGCAGWTSRQLQEGRIIELRCQTESNKDFWLSATFVFYPHSFTPPLKVQPICSDLNGIFAVLIAE